MTTNTPIIFVHDNGLMVFGRYIKTMPVTQNISIRYEDRGTVCRATVTPENVFPRTNDGLNLAFERSAHLRLKEAVDNNETDLLPTEAVSLNCDYAATLEDSGATVGCQHLARRH